MYINVIILKKDVYDLDIGLMKVINVSIKLVIIRLLLFNFVLVSKFRFFWYNKVFVYLL